MTQRTLEERVADLERKVAELSARTRPREGGMTGAELVAYMQMHGQELSPIFEEAMKLRQKDRERAYRKFDRKQARKAAKKKSRASRRAKS